MAKALELLQESAMADLLTLVARSSSHFSRVTRIYAAELGVVYQFEPVYDLKPTDPWLFGDNPMLRVPSLRTPEGTWFGSINVCREFARRATVTSKLVWPEDLVHPLSANAQEIVLDAMGTGVVIITARGAGIPDDSPSLVKPLARLKAALSWLEANLDGALGLLPERTLSSLEVTAFCLLTHLNFRGLGTLDDTPKLRDFCDRFGARQSAQSTEYKFD
jgi:glutathione S-transferase